MMEMDVGVVPRTAGNIRSEERGPEQSPSELTKEPTCQHIHLRLLEPFRAFRINDPNMFFLNPQIKKKKVFLFSFPMYMKDRDSDAVSTGWLPRCLQQLGLDQQSRTQCRSPT